MSRHVDDKEIPIPYKWKIDEELQSPVYNIMAEPKYYSDKSTYEYWLQEAHKRYNSAIKFFDKSLNIKPNVDACIGKASAFEELGKYDQAIKCYDDYLEKQQHKITYMKLLKRVGTLLRLSRKAVVPDNLYEVAKACWYKGSLLTKLHRYTEAIQCYEKSEKLGFA
jgi:tetratricopeptide (TPR) repeat protein